MDYGKDVSQDLLPISWRPLVEHGCVFSVPVRSAENQECPWYAFSLKASRAKTQEDPMFQFNFRGRKKLLSQPQKQSDRRNYLSLGLFVLGRL